jgi:hypothetical protein
VEINKNQQRPVHPVKSQSKKRNLSSHLKKKKRKRLPQLIKKELPKKKPIDYV